MIRRPLLAAVLALTASATAAPFETSGITDWTRAPAPGPEPTFHPPVARRARLANGISVLIVEDHTLPLVAIELVAPGAGAASDPRGKRGLAALTADLLDEGAGTLSAIGISDALGQLGAQLATEADTDAARISVRTLSRTLDDTLALVGTLVTQPTFASADLERVRGDRLTALGQRRDRPREVAALMLLGALYGREAPYGHPRDGERSDVAALTVDDVRTFHRTRWNPADMTIVVVGDVNRAAIAGKLNAALGAYRPAGARTSPVPAAAPAKHARLLVADRPGAAQSDVRIGLIGPRRTDPRYFAFEVVRNALGGGFTSRITQRLREQLGIVYHAYATMVWRRAAGPLIVDAAIVTDKTATGISEVLKILDDLAANDLPAAELTKAKQSLVRGLPERFGSVGETASAFAELALHKLPDDWYAQYAAGIQRVTARDVRAAAKALLPSGGMTVSVVGDLAKIRGELDQLGLGAPALHDLDAAPLPAR